MSNVTLIITQAADVLRLEKETAEKLAAKAFAKSYLADLVPSVFNNLRENGYFYDPVQRDLETGLMPWLAEGTVARLGALSLGRLLLDSIVREVVVRRVSGYKEVAEYFRAEAESEERAAASGRDNEFEEPNGFEEAETSNQDEVTVGLFCGASFLLRFFDNTVKKIRGFVY